MSDPVRIGLIGYGLAGRLFHAPVIAAAEGVELAAVATSKRDEVLARYPSASVLDPQALLEDASIELVVVAAPNIHHFDLARRALEQRKHVVVDKPITTTWVEAQALGRLAWRSGRILAAYQNRRWDSDFLTVRRLLADGRVGRPVLLESRFDRCRPQPNDRWREKPGPGAGLWFDLGPHLVDQSLQLFGLPERLTADIRATRPGAAVDDDFHVTLHYPGLRAILRAGSLFAVETPCFTLVGEAGAYIKHGRDPQESQLAKGVEPGSPGWGVDLRPGVLTPADPNQAPSHVEGEVGDYRRFYAAVALAVRGESPNPVPPEEAMAVMAILELAQESAAQGRTLPVATDPRLVAS